MPILNKLIFDENSIIDDVFYSSGPGQQFLDDISDVLHSNFLADWQGRKMEEPPTATYGSGVLIGPWLERRTLVEAVQEKFISDYKSGRSKLQKTRLMRANLTKPVSLAVPDSLVRIGSIVQIVAPEMPGFGAASVGGHYGMALATTVPEMAVDNIQTLHHGCPLVATPILDPCTRNTWKILGADGTCTHASAPLLMGQIFTLAAVISGPDGQPLYARSSNPVLNALNISPMGTPLALSCLLDRFCLFRVIHIEKEWRPETENSSFAPFTRLLINHVASNQNLCVEGAVPAPTFFGAEKAASIHTYTKLGRPVNENVWMFVTQRIQKVSVDKRCPPAAEKILNPLGTAEHGEAISSSKAPIKERDPCAVPPTCPLKEKESSRTGKSGRPLSSPFAQIQPRLQSLAIEKVAVDKPAEISCPCRTVAPCPYVRTQPRADT